MSDTQKSLVLIVYAPALAGHDSRPLAIVHGMEHALPGLRLEWTSSEKEDLIALPDRDAWVEANRRNGGFPFLCNDDEKSLVTVAGWENPNGLAAASPPHFEVHVDLPLNEAVIMAVADVLEAIGASAQAFWGRVLPEGVAVTVAQQFRHSGDKHHVPPKGLPALKLPRDISAPEIPHYLGWLNYWSAATAQALKFPDPAHDSELLSRARRTAMGGWIVQLTEAPLDLDNPAHLDALKRAYQRFPEIGGRLAP